MGTLSDTPEGKLWVSQFDAADRDAAELLLNSVITVTNEEYDSGMKRLITNFAAENHDKKIALFVAREIDVEYYWRDKTKRPKSVNGTIPVGSEGSLSHLCRDIVEHLSNVLYQPGLDEMKKEKCYSVFIVDDIIATGRRITKFVNWLYRTKTIKSWHSYHKIEFVPCAYLASSIGREKIESHKLFSDLLVEQTLSFGRTAWTPAQRNEIVELCRKYSEYTSRPFWPLGFKDPDTLKEAFTLVAFGHKCPNTNPAILWASKEGSWWGIFSERPQFIFSKYQKKSQRQKQEDILRSIGHTKSIESSTFSKLSDESRELLVLLSCISDNRRKENILCDILEITLYKVRHQIARCQLYGWVDDKIRITDLGRKVLKSARKVDMTKKELSINHAFYYPQTFRAQ